MGASRAASPAELALGRILRIASRPFREGDLAEYHRCRSIIMGERPEPGEDQGPNWARDRLKGAVGD